MRLTTLPMMFACLATAASCVDAPDAADPADPGTDPAESSTAQASTVVNTSCAAACMDNADITVTDHMHGSYVRVPALTCAEQTTTVGIDMGTMSFHPWIEAHNVGWNLNSTDRQSECEASLFALRIQQAAGPDTCGMQDIYYQAAHPVWANGECGDVTFQVPVFNGRYEVRALAIDGPESEHRGYDEVEISGEAVVDGAGWVNPY